jgi:glucosylceramidase
VSKFVNPGAFRIHSNTFGNGSIESVAFKNPDGTKVLIVLNSASSNKKFKVQFSNKAFFYTLNVGAVVTFKWL